MASPFVAAPISMCDRKKQPSNPTPTSSNLKSTSDEKAVNDAFQAIKNVFNGLPAEEYQFFYFEDPSSFEDLQNKLAGAADLSGFVSNKLRFDWDANTCELVLRTPTVVHDVFTKSVSKLLDQDLTRIANEHEALEQFRNKIIDAGTGDITVKNEDDTLVFSTSPDGQFTYEETHDPPFIFETTYSQTRHEIAAKACKYLSGLPYCTVLICNLSYQSILERKKRNNIFNGSIWLYTSTGPNKAELLFDEEMFEKEGRGVEGNIKIPFALFIPQAERENLPFSAHMAEVCINFADLTGALSTAQNIQHQRDDRRRKRSKSPLQVKKRNGEIIRVGFLTEEDGKICQVTVEEDGKVEQFPKRRKQSTE
ncbi:hypothetical protein F4859DRAFT_344357 [Xylaria cf. heliscus]|nr:hypothetical protein F4859DRAFT_344357 [Xylaria cf. heliscus]